MALRLGVEDDVLPGARGARALPWVPIARKLLAHEYADAADDLGRFGDRPAEAGARLLAAEHCVADGRRDDADVQRQKARAIYHSLGATRYPSAGRDAFRGLGMINGSFDRAARNPSLWPAV